MTLPSRLSHDIRQRYALPWNGQLYEPPREPRRLTRALDLPYEALSNIASFLNVRDRGAWRLASRTLRSAADAPVNLRRLIMKLVRAHPGIYPDYKVTCGMSSVEMRKWYYKRTRMRQVWVTITVPLSTRVAPAVHYSHSMETMYLVPGGRWLLLGNSCQNAGLMAHNLDLENMNGSELVGRFNLDLEEQRPNAECLFRMDVCMCEDSPVLKFLLATFHKIRIKNTVDWQCLRVWEIEEAGEGEGAFLRSLKLAKIPIHNVGGGSRPQGVSIQGKHVAYFGEAFTSEQGWKSRVEIFQWTECSDELASLKVGTFVCDPIYAIRIIGNRVLCVHDGRVGIYGLPVFHSLERNYIPPLANLKPSIEVAAWRFHLDKPITTYIVHTSRPAYTENGCHIVVNFGCGILELKLSGSLWVDGKMLSLPEHLRMHCSGVTRGCSLRQCEKELVNRIYYEFDDRRGHKIVQCNGSLKKAQVSGRLFYLGFDEGTGRVVYSWKQAGSYPAFLVIDHIVL